jgi:hypothetical protein
VTKILANEALLENIYAMSGNSRSISLFVLNCQKHRETTAKFLAEFDRDQGKMRPDMVKTQKATSLPDEADEEKASGQRAAD